MRLLAPEYLSAPELTTRGDRWRGLLDAAMVGAGLVLILGSLAWGLSTARLERERDAAIAVCARGGTP